MGSFACVVPFIWLLVVGCRLSVVLNQRRLLVNPLNPPYQGDFHAQVARKPPKSPLSGGLSCSFHLYASGETAVDEEGGTRDPLSIVGGEKNSSASNVSRQSETG